MNVTFETLTPRVDTQDDSIACPEIPPLRVLVVDDSVDCAESTAILLRMEGYEVQTAVNGFAALALAWESPPDVVLLDIGLPEMDGYEVAKRLLKQSTKKKPLLIAISGFGREIDVEHSKETGIDIHLVKPADPEQLRLLLAQLRCSAVA
jgi:CheY-like chemotaxis protein